MRQLADYRSIRNFGLEALARTFADARPQRLDYAIADQAGKERAYTASIVPILRDGAVASALLTALDVTEQKAAEQAIRTLNSSLEARVRERTLQLEEAMRRVEAASRAKSEFLSRMSHELRTPMNAILGFSHLIEASDTPPKERRWAGEIRSAGEHLLQMIDELLDLARIEVGKMVIHLEAVEPALVVAEAVGIVQPMVAARELHLIQHDVAVGLAVRADRLRLRQVLVNLLANAVKYNRAGGEITVRCERRGEQVRISVGDTGPGIAPEHLDRLFLPFERLGAEGGGVEGTGIGLALSKQLAELMGGALGVDTNVGVGSVFWVDLPLAKAGRA